MTGIFPATGIGATPTSLASEDIFAGFNKFVSKTVHRFVSGDIDESSAVPPLNRLVAIFVCLSSVLLRLQELHLSLSKGEQPVRGFTDMVKRFKSLHLDFLSSLISIRRVGENGKTSNINIDEDVLASEAGKVFQSIAIIAPAYFVSDADTDKEGKPSEDVLETIPYYTEDLEDVQDKSFGHVVVLSFAQIMSGDYVISKRAIPLPSSSSSSSGEEKKCGFSLVKEIYEEHLLRNGKAPKGEDAKNGIFVSYFPTPVVLGSSGNMEYVTSWRDDSNRCLQSFSEPGGFRGSLDFLPIAAPLENLAMTSEVANLKTVKNRYSKVTFDTLQGEEAPEQAPYMDTATWMFQEVSKWLGNWL